MIKIYQLQKFMQISSLFLLSLSRITAILLRIFKCFQNKKWNYRKKKIIIIIITNHNHHYHCPPPLSSSYHHQKHILFPKPSSLLSSSWNHYHHLLFLIPLPPYHLPTSKIILFLNLPPFSSFSYNIYHYYHVPLVSVWIQAIPLPPERLLVKAPLKLFFWSGTKL